MNTYRIVKIIIQENPNTLGQTWYNVNTKTTILVDGFYLMDGITKPRIMIRKGKLTKKAKEYIDYKPMEMFLLKEFLKESAPKIKK